MTQFFVLIPAAGTGTRMNTVIPKQYLRLSYPINAQGKKLFDAPILQHVIHVFAQVAIITQTFVIVSPNDPWIDTLDFHHLPTQILHCGGQTRAQSVLNGLLAIETQVHPDDWILIHDAARPCITPTAIQRLIQALKMDSVGGLLALPVADTLKLSTSQTPARASATLPRTHLWQAQTPQMFRYTVLRKALLETASQPDITDEASAIESLGLHPQLVMGDPRNIKVTWPLDQDMAACLLQSYQR